MKYVQIVKFEKEFVIEAPNAGLANEILDERIRDTEFDGDVRNRDGFYNFEDEDIECPKCKGACEVDEKTCDKCDGEGQVPFGTV